MPGRPGVWYVGGEDVHLRIPLLQRVREAGFDVAAVGTCSGKLFEAVDIPYFTYDLLPGIRVRADITARRQLSRLFKKFQPDIVHCFDTKPCVIAPLAAQACNSIQCIRTITGMGRIFSGRGPGSAILRSMYRFAQKRAAKASAMTVLQNDDDREYFVDTGLVQPGRFTIVRGSGVDVAALLASAPSVSETEALDRSEPL